MKKMILFFAVVAIMASCTNTCVPCTPAPATAPVEADTADVEVPAPMVESTTAPAVIN